MTAVAVWAQPPSNDALLEDRLAAGWKPTASQLVSGPRILGYADKVPPEGWSQPGERRIQRANG